MHPFPTATLLPNGKVLLVGDASAELYDPGNGVFTSAGPLVSPRQIHTATLLANGTVLIAGGAGGTGLGLAPSTALPEIYDPATNSFAPTGSMEIGRLWHTATLLRDGSVLVAGGAFSGDGLHVAALHPLRFTSNEKPSITTLFQTAFADRIIFYSARIPEKMRAAAISFAHAACEQPHVPRCQEAMKLKPVPGTSREASA